MSLNLQPNDFVFILIGVIGVIATLATIYFQLKKKSLKYKVILLEDTLFLPDPDIKIIVKGRETKEVQIARLEFRSDGFGAISKGDFEQNLTIDFGENVKIYKVEAEGHRPNKFAVHGEVKDNIITIHPLLLNRGDAFYVDVLLSGFRGNKKDITVAGRIEGIPEIKYARDYFSGYYFFTYIPAVIVLTFLLGASKIASNWNRIKTLIVNDDYYRFLGVVLVVTTVLLFFVVINMIRLRQLYKREGD